MTCVGLHSSTVRQLTINKTVKGIFYVILTLTCVSAKGSTEDEEFSGHRNCYSCEGPVHSSDCGDPFLAADNTSIIDCYEGACVKWIIERDGKMILERTCSNLFKDFRIRFSTVCITERRGAGILCMCSEDLCNSARSSERSRSGWRMLYGVFALLIFLV